jgi:hypothetical protein
MLTSDAQRKRTLDTGLYGKWKANTTQLAWCLSPRCWRQPQHAATSAAAIAAAAGGPPCVRRRCLPCLPPQLISQPSKLGAHLASGQPGVVQSWSSHSAGLHKAELSSRHTAPGLPWQQGDAKRDGAVPFEQNPAQQQVHQQEHSRQTPYGTGTDRAGCAWLARRQSPIEAAAAAHLQRASEQPAAYTAP